MSDILDRLAEKSRTGQDTFNGPIIPTVKLDGSGDGDTAGHILKYANNEVVDLGDGITMQIIRVRRKLLQGGELTKYFSSEYDSQKDKLTLRMCQRANDKEPWGKPTVVAEGTATEIRGTHDVKVASVVYGLIDGALVKFTIKGASCTGDDGLYEYLDTFKGDFIGKWNTVITVSKVQKNRAISYHRMHFKRGSEIIDGFEQVEQYLDMINGVAPVATTSQVTDESW